MIPLQHLRFYAAMLQWDRGMVKAHLEELFHHFREAGEMPFNVQSGQANPEAWITNRLMDIYKEQFRAEKDEGEV
jgi:hypothetical protein